MHTPPSHINGGSHYEFHNGTHHLCETREYTFTILRKYTIISNHVSFIVKNAIDVIILIFIRKC